MLTSDLALLHDPIYNNISQVYLANFTKLTDDFSRACKSCHATINACMKPKLTVMCVSRVQAHPP